MTIINSEGRFILVEKTLAYPHCDIVTKDTHGPFFDLSVDLDNFEGVPYVKAAHVEEMAKTLGMATKEEVAILNERIRILEAENTRLPGESEELVNGINNLVAVYHRNIRSAGDVRAELFGSSTIEDLGESDDNSSGGNESSDIKPSGKSGSAFGPNDRDDFEIFERVVEPNGQADSNAGDKGPNSVSASSSDEFGLG